MIHQKYQNTVLPFDIITGLLPFEVKGKTGPIYVDSKRSVSFRDSTFPGAQGPDTVCLFGVGRDDSSTILRALKTHSGSPIEESPSMRGLSDLTLADGETTYLIVNVDAMGDLEDAVDELIAFRKRCPDVVVLMISAFVLSDDFGSYRQLICDATLRSPISQGRFEGGLVAARQNNLHRLPQIISAA